MPIAKSVNLTHLQALRNKDFRCQTRKFERLSHACTAGGQTRTAILPQPARHAKSQPTEPSSSFEAVHAYRRGLELPPDDALAYVLRQPLDEVT
jgi:hypothetical protein